MSELNDGHRTNHGQQGAIARALLWLLGGLVLAVASFVAVTPELIGNETGIVMELVGIVGLAAIPGMVLLVLAAIHRKRLGLDDPGPGAGDEVGSDHHRHPRPDQDR